MLKRLAPLLALCSLALALALAACGNSQSPGATNAPPGGTGNTNNGAATTVNMTPSGFPTDKITIKEGQTVNFTNPSNGYERDLCIGLNGICKANPSGPSDLTRGGGMVLRPGSSKDVTFGHEGTYHLTSANQGAINLTVVVNEAAGP